jgi:hypothetical protein
MTSIFIRHNGIKDKINIIRGSGKIGHRASVELGFATGIRSGDPVATRAEVIFYG